MNENIFETINDSEKIAQLIKDLLMYKSEIICKSDDDIFLKVLPVSSDKKNIKCQSSQNLDASLNGDEELICTFKIGVEKYFFTSRIGELDLPSIILIQIPAKLFHLQRRQHYRLVIPPTYKAQLQLDHPGRNSVFGQIFDLSAGGCRAAYDIQNLSFKIDQEVSGQIMVNKKEPIKFQGIIKHIRNNVIGVEFRPFTGQFEQKVFALTMDLHKQFFSYLSTK